MNKQLLATLIHMKTYRNAASLTKIGHLWGIRKSIIDKVYYWVIKAIQASNLHTTYITWPAKAKKKNAKRWLEEQARVKRERIGFV